MKKEKLKYLEFHYKGLHAKCMRVKISMAKSVQVFLTNYTWYVITAMMQESIEISVKSLWQCNNDSIASQVRKKDFNK
jgi:hypothetical protein